MIENIEVAGAGALLKLLEERKKLFASEGLFDAEKKLPLPSFPAVIGVITSPDGAAIRDFINVAKRRAPWLTIKIFPAVVQGANCTESVIRGIEFFNRSGNQPDVLVITRGGGSMEDLWGFNSEALARAVAASAVPTVSAIGHEIDFTICDFAASLRAPTPSAAAELIAPDITELTADLANKYNRLQRAWDFQYLKLQSKLKNIADHRIFHEPETLLQNQSQKLDELSARLFRAWSNSLQSRQNHLQIAQAKLAAMDPAGVLKRGFAILHKSNGSVADSCSKLSPGEKILAQLADGAVKLTVD